MEGRPDIPSDRQLVQAYRPGGFRVSGQDHQGSLLVLRDRTLAWAPRRYEDVDLAALAPVLAAEPAVEILILGSGADFRLPDPALRGALRRHGIVVEGMTTPAGCRTYNVLLAENRRVAAALLVMPSP